MYSDSDYSEAMDFRFLIKYQGSAREGMSYEGSTLADADEATAKGRRPARAPA